MDVYIQLFCMCTHVRRVNTASVSYTYKIQKYNRVSGSSVTPPSRWTKSSGSGQILGGVVALLSSKNNETVTPGAGAGFKVVCFETLVHSLQVAACAPPDTNYRRS